MPRICYIPKTFSRAHAAIIEQADEIGRQYAAQGYTLTLRQVYYQFVARGWLANTQTEYKRLGSILNDARLAGELDWDHMEDRTRAMRERAHWETPGEMVNAAARSYHRDLWAGQPFYLECWIEKDALVGVIEPVCRRQDIAYFSCRGYTSQSEVWSAGRRIVNRCQGQADGGDDRVAVILHLGDHDPSGKDMTRDITERLALFCDYEDLARPQVRRLALNMDQVRQYNPPPNPAKLSDSRAQGYIAEFGAESWELDALNPPVIGALIDAAVADYLVVARYRSAEARQEDERLSITRVASHWAEVAVSAKQRWG